MFPLVPVVVVDFFFKFQFRGSAISDYNFVYKIVKTISIYFYQMNFDSILFTFCASVTESGSAVQ
jgi:hypothetical protein